ncbi:MAG: histone deacetylase [Nitrospirae bacterium]|nr:MAG: histone deacetylase [Nitrospirota bacterium]
MSGVGFITSEIYLEHRPFGFHPERPERLQAIWNTLKERGLWEKLKHLEPVRAEDDDITLAHSPEYLSFIKQAQQGYLDPDTYFSENSLEPAYYAAGAMKTAVDLIKKGDIKHAFLAVRPPGHHATTSRAMGFCIFNNVAIGARIAQKAGFQKVFVVDFDVHHGNGTEEIFYEDDTVFYFSTHQYPHYPGTGDTNSRGRGKGEGFTYNIPMTAGAGDREFFTAYNDILPALVERFSPDIILCSAGYDLRAEDPLASLRVTGEGIRQIVRAILQSGGGSPVIMSLEGGYDLKALADSVAITVSEMLQQS